MNPAVNHRLCKLIMSDNVYMSRIFGNSPPNGNDILISAAFSSASWRSMEAAWNCYKEFLLVSKLLLDKAPCQKVVSDLITWMSVAKNLKHSSIQSYLSSITTILKLKNVDCAAFTTYLTKTLCKGVKTIQMLNCHDKQSRKVITLELLRLIGHEIATAKWKIDSKRVFWTACCMMFFGSFRISEILSTSEKGFDPMSCLLWGDLLVKESSFLVHVKCSKNRSVEGDFVDIFEFEDKSCCPVRALRGLKSHSPFNTRQDLPVFAFRSGTLLTPAVFNKTLRFLISPHLGGLSAEYSSHSFRAAISSALAKFPFLVSEDEIKCWGRWDSAAFKKYTRLKSDQRLALHGKVTSALLFRPPFCNGRGGSPV